MPIWQATLVIQRSHSFATVPAVWSPVFLLPCAARHSFQGRPASPFSFENVAARSLADEDSPHLDRVELLATLATSQTDDKENLMVLSDALPILRALADGVNPVTGEVFSEISPYAEPRTLRALFSAVDLMEREVTREKRRARLPANFGKPWTESEDLRIGERHNEGMPLQEIARLHERTQSSCRLRLEKLGLISPQNA